MKISSASQPVVKPSSLAVEDDPLPPVVNDAPVAATKGWQSAANPKPARRADPGPSAGGDASPAAPPSIDYSSRASVINSLASNPGFKGLSTDAQATLAKRLSSDLPWARVAKASFGALLQSEAYTKGSPAEQTAALQKYLSDEVGLPDVASANAPPPAAQPYSLSQPTPVHNFPFASGPADGQKYTVTVNGHALDVVVGGSKPDGTYQHGIEQVAQGLAALPEASQKLVHQVTIEPNFNPGDAHWAEAYHDPNFHAYMTAGSAGDVSIFPTHVEQTQANLNGSLIHETGHTLSKRTYGEDSTQGAQWQAWQAAGQKDGTHVSAYARSSNDEDFAETLELYQQVKGTPQEASARAVYANRFAVLDQLLAPAAAK